MGGKYNDSWKLRVIELSKDEKEALESILKARKFRAIYRIPEVDYPAGNPTPDILIDGVKLEIKTPARLKEETISGMMRQANKQTKGGALLLNAPKITESITQIQLQEVVEKAVARRGGRGVVVSGGSLLFGYRRKEGL